MASRKLTSIVILMVCALPLGATAKSAYDFFMSYSGTNIDFVEDPAYRALVEENSYHDEFNNFRSFANRCAPGVDLEILEGIVRTESKFHPFAVGISKGPYVKNQPKTVEEAVALMKKLDAKRIDYSVGLGQINVRNFKRFGLTRETVLDPCENLKVAAKVLMGCEDLVNPKLDREGTIKATLVCYNTGNYKRSYKGPKAIESKYGSRVLRNIHHNNEGQALWWPTKDAMEAYAQKKMGDEKFMAALDATVSAKLKNKGDANQAIEEKEVVIYTDENLKSLENNLALNADSLIHKEKIDILSNMAKGNPANYGETFKLKPVVQNSGELAKDKRI